MELRRHKTFWFVFGLSSLALLSLIGCEVIGKSKEQYVQRGNELFSRGEIEEATINYLNALKKDPTYAEAYFRYGLLLSKDAKVFEALAMLEKALVLKPDHEGSRLSLANLYLEGLIYVSPPPQIFYEKLQRICQDYLRADSKSFHGHRLLGHLAMLDSKPADAATHFRIALEGHQDSAEIATLLTQSLLSSGETAVAENFARRTLNANPSHAALYDILYAHYRNTNRPREAEGLLQQKISANPRESLYLIQLARHYRSLRLPKLMDETLTKVTDAGSPYRDGLLVAGDFLRDSGEVERAAALYQRGAQGGPPMDTTYRKRLVDLHLRSNRTKEAADLLEALLQANPNDEESLAARASLRAASGRTAEIDSAISDFLRLIAAHPKAVLHRYHLAGALRMRGRDNDARAQLLKVLESDPNHLPSLEEMAAISIQRASAKEALSYASRALALNPRTPRTRLVYSAALALLGRSAEARQEINQLITEYPTLREAHLQRALINIQDRRFQEAESIYRQYYKPGMNDPRILRGLIELGFASGRPEQVLQSLQQEVKLRPDSAEMRMMLATTAARMNKATIAIEHFQWLKQNMPPSPNVEMAIGMAYQSKRDWPSAIARFQSARTLAPRDADVIATLAYALQQSGRPGDAVPLYRESLQIKPDLFIVRNNLAVALTDSGGDLDEALHLAQTAVSKSSSDPLFSDALGLVYLKRKEATKAIQSFRFAVGKDPENVSFRIHLAKALTENGNLADAKAELAGAASRRPTAEESKEISDLSAAFQRR